MKILHYGVVKSKSRVLKPKNRLLFTERIRRNISIGTPGNWDGFFEKVSQLNDLDGFLSASDREQPTQDRNPFGE